MLLKLNSKCLELRPKKGFGGEIFSHWRCLELSVHGGNKKQADFLLVLLFFNSLKTMFPLTFYTWVYHSRHPEPGASLPRSHLEPKYLESLGRTAQGSTFVKSSPMWFWYSARFGNHRDKYLRLKVKGGGWDIWGADQVSNF